MSNETQDAFLTRMVDEQKTVHVFLANGIKLIGTITEHDDYTIFLSGQSDQLIYKNNIATVVVPK